MDKDGSGGITPDEVEDLLFQTYGFPPLENEVEMFMEKFDLNQDGKVTLEEFKKALSVIREEMKKKIRWCSRIHKSQQNEGRTLQA